MGYDFGALKGAERKPKGDMLSFLF